MPELQGEGGVGSGDIPGMNPTKYRATVLGHLCRRIEDAWDCHCLRPWQLRVNEAGVTRGPNRKAIPSFVSCPDSHQTRGSKTHRSPMYISGGDRGRSGKNSHSRLAFSWLLRCSSLHPGVAKLAQQNARDPGFGEVRKAPAGPPLLVGTERGSFPSVEIGQV